MFLKYLHLKEKVESFCSISFCFKSDNWLRPWYSGTIYIILYNYWFQWDFMSIDVCSKIDKINQ